VTIDVKDIIRAVGDSGLLLSKDDPVLAVVAVSEAIWAARAAELDLRLKETIEQAAEQFRRSMVASHASLEKLGVQIEDSAAMVSGRVEISLDATSRSIQAILLAEANRTTSVMRSELAEVLLQVRAATKTAARARTSAVAASAFAVGSLLAAAVIIVGIHWGF
jgi:hypothetical protein